MTFCRKKVLDAFAEYTSHYNCDDPKIKLKVDHTYRVADYCEQIADSLALSKEDVDLAWLIGMLHDIGRFEQILRYNTFNDAVSVNHAAFGADLLFCEGLLARFVEKMTDCPAADRLPESGESVADVTLLESAIRHHSAYRLPEGLTARELLFCNIIRDADKLDIFRVNIETPIEDIYNVTTEEILHSSITPAVLDAFHEHHCVLRALKKEPLDHLVGHASLAYELVFPYSRRAAAKDPWYARIFRYAEEHMPERTEICATFRALQEEMLQFLSTSPIAVIHTGGTIGSTVKDGIIRTDHHSVSALSSLYSGNALLTEEWAMEILSENMQPENLSHLIDVIDAKLQTDCRGILITHGTDTLSFTANLLSVVYAQVDRPIVLVSALYPPKDPRSNALANFTTAIDYILGKVDSTSAEGVAPGVYVSFANPGEKSRIYPGAEVLPLRNLGNAIPCHSMNRTELCEKLTKLPRPIRLATDILTIPARSLNDYRMYRFDTVKPRAVVIELYHSGTICTAGTDMNVLPFLEYCKSLDIPVVLGPVDREADLYESALALRDHCQISYNRSFEMTTVLTMLALGNDLSLAEMFCK